MDIYMGDIELRVTGTSWPSGGKRRQARHITSKHHSTFEDLLDTLWLHQNQSLHSHLTILYHTQNCALVCRLVRITERSGLSAGDEHTLEGTEVRIAIMASASCNGSRSQIVYSPLNTRLLVQERNHGVHELDLLLGRARARKLRHPHRLAILLRHLRDVRLEVRHVRRTVVHVHRDRVDRAARARGQEAVHPARAHRGWGAVRDRGRDELDPAGEGLDEVLPGTGGGLGGQVGLGGEVGLVEAEDVGCAGGDGSLGVLLPASGVVGISALYKI
jgi:hypothetical protein